MIQGLLSLGSKLNSSLFLPSEHQDHTKSLRILSLENFFFPFDRGEYGGGGGNEEIRVGFPSRCRGGYSWLSFWDVVMGKATIRTLDMRVRARRSGETMRRPGPEAQETKPGGWPTYYGGAAGMAGVRPRAKASSSHTFSGCVGWAETSTQAHPQACLPGPRPRRALRPASHPSHLPKRP